MFDIVKEDWIPIMDADRTHDLTHKNVSGTIPAPRVQATGQLFESMGAAFIIGGMN